LALKKIKLFFREIVFLRDFGRSIPLMPRSLRCPKALQKNRI